MAGLTLSDASLCSTSLTASDERGAHRIGKALVDFARAARRHATRAFTRGRAARLIRNRPRNIEATQIGAILRRQVDRYAASARRPATTGKHGRLLVQRVHEFVRGARRIGCSRSAELVTTGGDRDDLR